MNKKKVLKGIIILILALFIAFMFEEGLALWGLGGLILLTIVVAVFRLYLGWEQYIAVVNMGAEQLHLMKQVRGINKNGKKKRK